MPQITHEPAKIHTAFNSVLFTAKVLSNEIECEYVVEVNTPRGLKTYGFRREFLEDTTTINFKEFICNLFTDLEEKLDNTYPPRLVDAIVIDNRQFIRYRVKLAEQEFTDKLALNAVVQLGQSSDLTILENSFLSGWRELRKYAGYPLQVTFLSDMKHGEYVNQGYITLNIDKPLSQQVFNIAVPDDVPEISISLEPLMEPLTTNDNVIITTNDERIIYVTKKNIAEIGRVRIPVINMCIPNSPFYVRWINQKGGWDHFMFSDRQRKTFSLNDVQVFTPVMWSQENEKSTSTPYSGSGENTVVVGVENLTADDFEVVKTILFSPLIQHFDELTKKWIPVYLAKGEVNQDTRQSLQLVEYEFTLPKQILQI